MRFTSAAILLCAFHLPALSLQDPGLRILVFPLENGLASNGLSWLGEGIALSVTDQLAGAGIDAIRREERVRLTQESDLPTAQPLTRGSMLYIAGLARADLVIFGSYSGSEASLRVDLTVLDARSLRIGGGITGNGPLAALPQIENDLAWLILANNGLNGSLSREKFRLKARTTPNSAYARYVIDLTARNE